MKARHAWFRSAIVAAFLLLGNAARSTAADAPMWMAALHLAGQQVNGLRWMPVDGATGYKVLRSMTPGSGYSEIASTTVPQHFDGLDLQKGVTYYYVLQSVDGDGVSGFSREQTVVIPAEREKVTRPPQITALDTQLANEFGKTVLKVGVTWQPSREEKLFTYSLYRTDTPGRGYQLIYSGTNLRFLDADVKEMEAVCYVVGASNEHFREIRSVEACVDLKKAPPSGRPGFPAARPEGPLVIPARLVGVFKPAPGALPFNHVTDVRFSGGKIYALDKANHQVRVFSESGTELFHFGAEGDGLKPGELFMPNALTIDGSGRVYVTSAWNNQVAVFDGEGTPLGGFHLTTREDRVPYGAFGIAWRSGRNELWVGDLDHRRIEVRLASPPYQFIRELVTFDAVDRGELKKGMTIATPVALDFSPDDRLFVFDGLVSKLLKFDPESLALEAHGGGIGQIAGLLVRGGGVSVDSRGRVFAVDKVGGSIQVFDGSLEYLFTLGNEKGERLDCLAAPFGLHVQGRKVYVADRVRGVVVLEMAEDTNGVLQSTTH